MACLYTPRADPSIVCVPAKSEFVYVSLLGELTLVEIPPGCKDGAQTGCLRLSAFLLQEMIGDVLKLSEDLRTGKRSNSSEIPIKRPLHSICRNAAAPRHILQEQK